jgi:hypothetical protein
MRQDGRFALVALRKSLLISLLVVVAWGFLIIKGVPRLVGLWDGILEREEELEKIGELEEELRVLVGVDEEEMDASLRMVYWALPVEFDASRGVSAVSNQARGVGLDVAEFKAVVPRRVGDSGVGVKKKKNGKVLSSQRFSIVVSGSWDDWLLFLGRVNKMAPLSRITGMRISSSRVGEMNAEVDLVGYYAGGEVIEESEGGRSREVVESPVELGERQAEIWGKILELDYGIYEIAEGGDEGSEL